MVDEMHALEDLAEGDYTRQNLGAAVTGLLADQIGHRVDRIMSK